MIFDSLLKCDSRQIRVEHESFLNCQKLSLHQCFFLFLRVILSSVIEWLDSERKSQSWHMMYLNDVLNRSLKMTDKE